MNKIFGGFESSRRVFAALLAIILSLAAWTGGMATALAQAPATPAPVGAQTGALSWRFGAALSPDGGGWSIERGTMTTEKEAIILHPDRGGRVVLLSPPGLPDAVRYAEEFVLGLSGTGLRRIRVQARRDARGAWITIADASDTAIRQVAGGYAITVNPRARGAPVDRLRIEITLRTTNARPLTSISVIPGPR